jgi:hypothetical protein
MASTRNRNTTGNYALEQSQLNRIFESHTYLHGSSGCQDLSRTFLPGDGLIGGSVALPREYLASNAVDVESYLHGTGATDLTNPAKDPTVVPDSSYFAAAHIYKRDYTVQMPRPLHPEPAQRPGLWTSSSS